MHYHLEVVIFLFARVQTLRNLGLSYNTCGPLQPLRDNYSAPHCLSYTHIRLTMKESACKSQSIGAGAQCGIKLCVTENMQVLRRQCSLNPSNLHPDEEMGPSLGYGFRYNRQVSYNSLRLRSENSVAIPHSLATSREVLWLRLVELHAKAQLQKKLVDSLCEAQIFRN